MTLRTLLFLSIISFFGSHLMGQEEKDSEFKIGLGASLFNIADYEWDYESANSNDIYITIDLNDKFGNYKYINDEAGGDQKPDEIKPGNLANFELTVGSLYLFFNCLNINWPPLSSFATIANIRSAVAGNPNDSDIFERSGSELINPSRFNWELVMTGTLHSTANPRISSAIDLI